MRRGNKPSFIEDDGNLIGVYLSSDFCAEHEWGISDIRREFGIPWDKPKTYGLERRKATIVPDKYFGFPERKKPALLLLPYLSSYVLSGSDPREQVQQMLSKDGFSELHMHKAFGKYPAETLAAAWSGRDFGVMSAAVHRSKMREIHNAIMKTDVAIFIGGAILPVFDNPGLCITIASKIPAPLLKRWDDADREHERLMKEDAKNNDLKERLKAAGKDWFALSPSWINSKDSKSSSKVMYFLNPREQDKNNFGWMTVEDLEDWIKGIGVIPKGGKKCSS